LELEEYDQLPMGLDTAVAYSIARTGSESSVKKMYGCIIIIGGCAQVPGLGALLQERLALAVPALYARVVTADSIQVLSRPKGVDPRHLAWKGGTVAARLETLEECWLEPAEWEEDGLALAYERMPFVW
jgi:actin-related protein 8